MRADADIVILGAGCAGLSLAASLGAEKVPGSVLLLEPRSSYTRDRTWCFWNTEEHLFTSAISHRWESWRVSRGPQAVVQQSRRYQYCHIAGDDFYAEGLRAVERDPRQELCCGVSVDSVEPRAGGLVRVETSSGGIVARRVFDSRPAAPSVAPLLVQRFVGWHVRAARACFEERTVELMRFLPSDQPGRVRFLYLLPFSPTEALVEMTYLDAPELPEPFAENELKEWLEDNVREWEVLYKEQGALPMAPAGKPAAYSPMKASLALDHSLEHVHSIGARGGRLKPSSGYGFVRIQRHSRVIARALAQGRPVPLTAEPQRYSLMDAVFLRALQTADAAELFLAMFANADPDALVRFLGEASPVSETLRVAWSLPKLPMLGAAIRNWRAA